MKKITSIFFADNDDYERPDNPVSEPSPTTEEIPTEIQS